MATSTADQVVDKAHEAADRAAETADKAKDRVREYASDADERVREAASQGREHAEDMVGRANGFVRENPLMAVGIAFLVGVIGSFLMRRR